LRWLDTLTEKQPNSLYGVSVLKDTHASLAAPVSAFKPTVDQSNCSVTAVLTTRTADRQGDIIDPAGGDFDEHRTNPVVMFHHGKTHKLPIGKAEDANGNYTVRLVKARDGEVLLGTTHFSQSNRFAQDVFGLVAEDILRGVSIGFDPIDGEDSFESLGPSPVLERDAMHFKAWKLLEYSHTPIGVNRDALTVAVQKALEGSRKLDPRLLEILKPLTTPRKTTVTVSAEPKTNPNAMSATVEKAAGCAGMPKKQKIAIELNKLRKKGKRVPPPPKERKAMDDDEERDDEEMDGEPEGGSTTVASDDEYEPNVDDPSQDPNLPDHAGYGEEEEMPHTVKTLNDGAQGLLDMAAMLEENMKKSEHMGGRKYCGKLCADLRKTAAEMSAKADAIHNEIKGVEPPNPEDAEDADQDGDTQDAAEEESAGEEPEMPETDEEGAMLKKGYTPRRWTFHDVAASAVAAAPVEPANKKSLEKLKNENTLLRRELKSLLDDLEAGAARR